MEYEVDIDALSLAPELSRVEKESFDENNDDDIDEDDG